MLEFLLVNLFNFLHLVLLIFYNLLFFDHLNFTLLLNLFFRFLL